MLDKLLQKVKDDAHEYAIKRSAAPCDWEGIEDNYRAGVLAVWSNPAKYGLQRKIKGLVDLPELEEYFLQAGKKVGWSEVYCKEQAETFFDHFSSNGWKVGGKSKMVDWQAAVRTWVRRNNNEKHTQQKTNKHGGTTTGRGHSTSGNTKPREFGDKWQ